MISLEYLTKYNTKLVVPLIISIFFLITAQITPKKKVLIINALISTSLYSTILLLQVFTI